ncbi:MAG: hypothetical protein ABIH71_00255, partial [Candidatus Omnitrophota bacterium]
RVKGQGYIAHRIQNSGFRIQPFDRGKEDSSLAVSGNSSPLDSETSLFAGFDGELVSRVCGLYVFLKQTIDELQHDQDLGVIDFLNVFKGLDNKIQEIFKCCKDRPSVCFAIVYQFYFSTAKKIAALAYLNSMFSSDLRPDKFITHLSELLVSLGKLLEVYKERPNKLLAETQQSGRDSLSWFYRSTYPLDNRGNDYDYQSSPVITRVRGQGPRGKEESALSLGYFLFMKQGSSSLVIQVLASEIVRRGPPEGVVDRGEVNEDIAAVLMTGKKISSSAVRSKIKNIIIGIIVLLILPIVYCRSNRNIKRINSVEYVGSAYVMRGIIKGDKLHWYIDTYWKGAGGKCKLDKDGGLRIEGKDNSWAGFNLVGGPFSDLSMYEGMVVKAEALNSAAEEIWISIHYKNRTGDKKVDHFFVEFIDGEVVYKDEKYNEVARGEFDISGIGKVDRFAIHCGREVNDDGAEFKIGCIEFRQRANSPVGTISSVVKGTKSSSPISVKDFVLAGIVAGIVTFFGSAKIVFAADTMTAGAAVSQWVAVVGCVAVVAVIMAGLFSLILAMRGRGEDYIGRFSKSMLVLFALMVIFIPKTYARARSIAKNEYTGQSKLSDIYRDRARKKLDELFEKYLDKLLNVDESSIPAIVMAVKETNSEEFVVARLISEMRKNRGDDSARFIKILCYIFCLENEKLTSELEQLRWNNFFNPQVVPAIDVVLDKLKKSDDVIAQRNDSREKESVRKPLPHRNNIVKPERKRVEVFVLDSDFSSTGHGGMAISRIRKSGFDIQVKTIKLAKGWEENTVDFKS